MTHYADQLMIYEMRMRRRYKRGKMRRDKFWRITDKLDQWELHAAMQERVFAREQVYGFTR